MACFYQHKANTTILIFPPRTPCKTSGGPRILLISDSGDLRLLVLMLNSLWSECLKRADRLGQLCLRLHSSRCSSLWPMKLPFPPLLAPFLLEQNSSFVPAHNVSFDYEPAGAHRTSMFINVRCKHTCEKAEVSAVTHKKKGLCGMSRKIRVGLKTSCKSVVSVKL